MGENVCVTAYRVYVLDRDGHVAGPPQVLHCANDDEVTAQARQSLNGNSIEIWEGARRVVRLEPDE